MRSQERKDSLTPARPIGYSVAGADRRQPKAEAAGAFRGDECCMGAM